MYPLVLALVPANSVWNYNDCVMFTSVHPPVSTNRSFAPINWQVAIMKWNARRRKGRVW